MIIIAVITVFGLHFEALLSATPIKPISVKMNGQISERTTEGSLSLACIPSLKKICLLTLRVRLDGNTHTGKHTHTRVNITEEKVEHQQTCWIKNRTASSSRVFVQS